MIAGLISRFLPQLGIGALVAIAGLAAALAITRGRLDDVKDDLAIERALRERDRATYQAAQARANADWTAYVAKLKEEGRKSADEADRKNAALAGDYHAAVMRLPSAAALVRAARNAGLSAAILPEGTDGPGDDTVLLDRAAVHQCAVNTGRLLSARGWAIGELGRSGEKPSE